MFIAQPLFPACSCGLSRCSYRSCFAFYAARFRLAVIVCSASRTVLFWLLFGLGLFWCILLANLFLQDESVDRLASGAIVTTQVYFIKRYEGQKKKYCKPHLPQRTIFHTGLLHALRSHRSLQSAYGPQRLEHTRAQRTTPAMRTELEPR